MVKKRKQVKNGNIYENTPKENNDKKNEIKIASRRIEIYNQTILNKWQKFDQVEISVLDTYLDRALSIIKQWEALGITPTNGFPIKFVKKEEDILTKEGRKITKPINRITLTKQPDQYRFTKI